jgi:hypothetical protein
MLVDENGVILWSGEALFEGRIWLIRPEKRGKPERKLVLAGEAEHFRRRAFLK